MKEHHGGNLRGIRLLDVGSGLGESSVYFALQGMEVTATDVSEGMLEMAQQVAEHHGVQLQTQVANAETLPFEDNSFDAIYVANTIHHIPDQAAFFEDVSRVLKPGGWFYSWDPLAYNPAINIYRNMATEVRTEDEEPLRMDIFNLLQSRFENLGKRFFWMASLALFFKYFLVDRVHPNADRYWKRIYTETDRSLWWWKPLKLLDGILTRIPYLNRWSWNIVIYGQKPNSE